MPENGFARNQIAEQITAASGKVDALTYEQVMFVTACVQLLRLIAPTTDFRRVCSVQTQVAGVLRLAGNHKNFRFTSNRFLSFRSHRSSFRRRGWRLTGCGGIGLAGLAFRSSLILLASDLDGLLQTPPADLALRQKAITKLSGHTFFLTFAPYACCCCEPSTNQSFHFVSFTECLLNRRDVKRGTQHVHENGKDTTKVGCRSVRRSPPPR